MLSFFLLTLASFLIATDIDAAAGINKQISFQGKVVNTNGTNVANGSYTFVFSLYTVSSGGSNIWTESKSVTVTDGIFQTNLGDTTTLPGSVDFNTDNIYLGINFNADGEMTPRVRFTAAPYAFNAQKVGGLTVTDTTGTLTIPNGKTISFADAFSTSGAFATTLTATGTTNVTLPTTGTLATLAGTETLTNKTIGSTGLTFSGASTDITTASNEDLTLLANGTGTISLNDTVSVASTLTLSSITGSTQCLQVNTSGVVSGTGSTCGTSITADSLDFTEFQDTLDLDANTTINANDNTSHFGLTLTSNLSVGARTTAAMTLTQADNATNDFDRGSVPDAGLLSLVNNDIASDAPLLFIDQNSTASNGVGIYIDAPASSNNSGIRFSSAFSQGKGIDFFNAAAITTGTGISMGNQANPSTAFTGDYILVNPARTQTNATTFTDTGNFLELTRANTVNNASGTFNTTGDLATLASSITETNGTIIDSSNILSLAQNCGTNADCTGSVLELTNAGVGNGADFFLTNTAATQTNGLYVRRNGSGGTTTNGIQIASDAGTLTNGLLIADGAGTIDKGIQLTGTFTTNILDTPSLDISGAGAITGATGLVSSGTIQLSSLTTNGFVKTSSGNGTLTVASTIGASDITADSLDFTEFQDTLDLDANTNINANDGSTQYGLTLTSNLNIAARSAAVMTITQANDATNNFTSSTTGLLNLTNNDTGSSAPALYIDQNSTTSNSAAINIDSPAAASTFGIYFPSGVSNGEAISLATVSGAASGITMNSAILTSGTGLSIGGGGTGAINPFTGDGILVNPSRTKNSGATTISDTGNLLDISPAYTINVGGGTLNVTGDLATLSSSLTQTAGTISDSRNILSLAQNCGTGTTCSGSVLELTNAGTGNAADFFLTNTGGTQTNGLFINRNGSGGTTTNALHIGNAAGTLTTALLIDGTAPASFILDSASIDITGAGAITGATGVSTTTVTASGAIAANGGITFDQSTDTLGAHTLAGTIDANANILTNIGNSGTDFVASTGALTLAGVLTANGGISLSASQSLSAAALAYVDLGLITHSTTANQGLRLPNAASASPSNPTSGEGYLAWDAAGNQLITYNGSAWSALSGGGYNLIKDETTSLTARTTLAFLGAGVSCADNASQTECTIAGGSGADLQGTYDTDANGSNATISLTANDDGLVFTNPTSGGNDLSAFLLSLTQQNTTAGIVVLDMIQSSNAANGANLAANAIDGETGLAITTNGLTSGKGISVTSSVASNFTGNLADISLTGSGASNTGNVLAVSNTGTANANTSVFVDHRATGTGNLALRINDEASDTTPFIIDGDGRVGIGTSSISTASSTERLLQVGSETNRGNNVTYGEVVTKGLKDHTALTNIKDIFIYDTTADSDGGRWIDWSTTDQLSWYTEALDDGPSDPCVIASDDRCYNSAFPRRAILVVTTDALYIFDAATNTMWMKFSQNASGYALGVDTNNNPSSVTALNGVIYVGANGSASGGLYAIDFVNDRMWRYNGTDRSAANVGIGSRNTAVTYNVDSDTKLEISPVGTAAEWENVNDVYASVMTNSLSASAIGAATNTNPGYGKVYVALATDSGVTVINITEKVLNQYSDVTADDYTAVAISKKGYLFALNTTQDQLERWDTIDTDKASEVNGTFNRKWDETIGTGPAIASAAFNIVAGAPDNLDIIERASITLDTEEVIYVGHSLGLAELHDHTTQLFGWVKYYNSARETPMMYLAGINDMALPMDDTSGTQAQDLAIANTDMAIVGSPTLGVNGVQGKAINFDNSNDYLCSDADQNNTCDVDTAFNMSTVGWTLALWFRHSATAPSGAIDTIFEKCVTAAPAQATGCVIAYMNTAGNIVVANDTDATWTRPDGGGANSYNITATSTYAYNDNQWHQLVLSRTNADDLNSWIDGNGMNLSTATGGTTTFDGSQIATIGASCVLTVTANCAAVTNVWDGQIDDVQFAAGTTTQGTLSAFQVRRLYNSERPRASKKTISVTDATSATSTSLTDTGESWFVNEFAGQIVEITGSSDSDCIGVTRRITSNTATSMTFNPAVPGACTMDTSADFQVDPEALIGASDSVTSLGITNKSPLGEARQMCIGTNSGTDTGGVTCYNHQAGPSIVADVYHSQANQTDDSGTDWTGTDYDDIRAIDISNRALVMASEAHFTIVTEDVRLGQGLDYITNQLNAIRQEIMLDGTTAVGSIGAEIGFTGGADLAERYYSNEPLQAGEVVAIDSTLTAGVKKTTGRYQRDTLGIVATEPGIVLGTAADNAYPIALVGRVPVRVTNESGPIYSGDRLTAASRPGYAMRATQAGRVIGSALGDAVDWTVCEGEDPMNHDALLCTTVLVFVNLSDYYGQPVELALAEREKSDAAALETVAGDEEIGLAGAGVNVRLATAAPTREEKLLAFLKQVRDERAKSSAAPSEVFTDRVAASSEVVTPRLIADEIWAKSIKADSIEGLVVYTNRVASLEAKYAGLEADATGDAASSAEKTLLDLKQFQVGNIVVALDASILGKLSVTGALRVIDTAEFQGETTFAKLVSFLGDAVFRGRVTFGRTPTFGVDTAGFATIEKGRKKVRVSFAEAYEKQPIVTVAMTRDASPLLDGKADADLRADIAAVEQDFAESVFEGDVRYLVTEKDATGFTILLAEDAPADLSFSWVAIAVKEAKTFESGKGKNEPESDVPAAVPVEATQELVSPVETPSPEIPTAIDPAANASISTTI